MAKHNWINKGIVVPSQDGKLAELHYFLSDPYVQYCEKFDTWDEAEAKGRRLPIKMYNGRKMWNNSTNRYPQELL